MEKLSKVIISSNPNITLKFIEKYSDKPWYWEVDGISYNSNIILELIEKYPNKPWHWGYCGISSNPNITKCASLTIECIEKYPDKLWHWGQWVYHVIQILPKVLHRH